MPCPAVSYRRLLPVERPHPHRCLPACPCSTLFGLALSNLGVVPAEAPHVYGVVNAYLLPLAVPLLLFSADLRWAGAVPGQLLQLPVLPVGLVLPAGRALDCMPTQPLGTLPS